MRSLAKLHMVTAAIALISFSSVSDDSINAITGLSKRIRLASQNWKLFVSQGAQLPYHTHSTYLPELGIRGKYQSFKKVFQITFLEKLTKEKVFLKGPHRNGEINFNHPSHFGHYNPKFLDKLKSILEKELANEIHVSLFQDCYDKNFKKLLRVFYMTRVLVSLQDDAGQKYSKLLEQIKSGKKTENASFFLQEKFRPFTEVLKTHNFYEVISCSSFWVRRSLDNTDDRFKILLDLVLKKMDPEFFSLMQERNV